MDRTYLIVWILALVVFSNGTESDDMTSLTNMVQEMKEEIINLKATLSLGFTNVCPLIAARTKPKDCKDHQILGRNTSGVYNVYLPDTKGGDRIKVYCDMNTEGGGWTVIQMRQNGKQDFYTGWQNYENGFGNITGEHWLGNKNIHAVSSNGEYELLVVLTDFQHNTKKARYSSFSVKGSGDDYQLDVSGYSGDAGDSLGFDHNGHAFSTADHDVDGADKVNCAQKHHGGYWYSSCFKSNINGQWGKAGEQGIVWGSFKNWEMYVLKETTMMIRPVLH